LTVTSIRLVRGINGQLAERAAPGLEPGISRVDAILSMNPLAKRLRLELSKVIEYLWHAKVCSRLPETGGGVDGVSTDGATATCAPGGTRPESAPDAFAGKARVTAMAL